MLRRKFEEVDIEGLRKRYEQCLQELEYANDFVVIRDRHFPESIAVAVSKKDLEIMLIYADEKTGFLRRRSVDWYDLFHLKSHIIDYWGDTDRG